MSKRILIIDDDPALRESLAMVLASEGFEVGTAEDGEKALQAVDRCPYEIVLCDLRMPGIDGLELLPELLRRLPGSTILMMSAYGTEDLAIEAMNRGAYDYLAKPFRPAEVLLTIRKAQEREKLRSTNALLKRDVDRATGTHPIVAASPPMISVLEMMERAAGYKATVLITGESGTGKEVLARAIHDQSPPTQHKFRGRQLRGDPRNPSRERTLRSHPGRIHWCGPSETWTVRRSPWRNAVPRRNRRNAC